jgi:hypothetical protein
MRGRDSDREDPAIVEPLVVLAPRDPAVLAGLQAVVERADIDAIRVPRVDRYTLRADPG